MAVMLGPSLSTWSFSPDFFTDSGLRAEYQEGKETPKGLLRPRLQNSCLLTSTRFYWWRQVTGQPRFKVLPSETSTPTEDF